MLRTPNPITPTISTTPKTKSRARASAGAARVGADPFAAVDGQVLSADDKRALKRALGRVDANQALFRHDFRLWLINNWAIFRCFEDKANVVWDAGRTHYSARTLIEVVRHETFLREAHSQERASYKINNSYVPDVARLYGLLYPTREGFFECRVMSGTCMRGMIRSAAVH